MKKSLCYHINCSSKIQITKVSLGSKIYLERVLFPLQQILFEAPLEAHLEIHTSEIASAILSDRISCRDIQVFESCNSLELSFDLEKVFACA